MLKKFEDILVIYNGRNQKKVEDENGQYPIYGSGGIMGYANDFICPANTVIIGRKGSINNPIYVDKPLWNVDTAFGLVAKQDQILPKYLYYFCKYFNFEKLNTTVTIPSLTKSNLLKIEVEVSSIANQQIIVRKLEMIEKLIQLKKQELAKLDSLIKARFVEMFGTVVDNRFGYEIKSLQDICEPIRDGTHQTPTYTDDIIHGFKFLSSKDVTTRYVDWNHLKYIPKSLHDELYARIAPRKGDILLAKNGTTGVAAVVDRDEIFDIYVSLALLRPLNNINSIYLWAAINSNDVKKQFDSSLKGIGVPNLHLGEIKKAKILVPHISEQMNFEKFVKQVDKSKVVVQQSLEKAQMLFDSLMQQYFG